jgi:hypothetical protein
MWSLCIRPTAIDSVRNQRAEEPDDEKDRLAKSRAMFVDRIEAQDFCDQFARETYGNHRRQANDCSNGATLPRSPSGRIVVAENDEQ